MLLGVKNVQFDTMKVKEIIENNLHNTNIKEMLDKRVQAMPVGGSIDLGKILVQDKDSKNDYKANFRFDKETFKLFGKDKTYDKFMSETCKNRFYEFEQTSIEPESGKCF